jgi:hypothetical protein
LIIKWYFCQIYEPIRQTHTFLLWNLASLISITFILAIPLSILFETPYMLLMKMLIASDSHKKSVEKMEEYERVSEDEELSDIVTQSSLVCRTKALN